MADTEEPIVQSQEVVTVQSVPKKPRSEAQLAALEAARKKACAMRAEQSALKKQEEASKALAKVEAHKKPLDTTQHPKDETPVEEVEEPEVIYRKKPHKKKKRVVVVQEESSSDSEIEVRLPKANNPPIAPKKTPDLLRYERAYTQLFSMDTL